MTPERLLDTATTRPRPVCTGPNFDKGQEVAATGPSVSRSRLLSDRRALQGVATLERAVRSRDDLLPPQRSSPATLAGQVDTDRSDRSRVGAT